MTAVGAAITVMAVVIFTLLGFIIGVAVGHASAWDHAADEAND